MNDDAIILITGGCGYLGSQLIRELARDSGLAGAIIRILDNMQGNNYSALMDLPGDARCQFIEGDILDPTVLGLALQDVDVVVHLAAVERTPISLENPAWMEQVNHWGTARLVEACLEAGVEKIIYTSNTAVYGPGGPFTEDDPCQPFGAYAQSKYRAEQSIVASKDRGLKPVILRMGTVYGYAPVMRFDAVANRFAYLAGTGRSLTVFGRGDQVRPFVNIRDACGAIIHCLAAVDKVNGQIFNVVNENASVLELVDVIVDILPDTKIRYTEQDVLTHISMDASNAKLINTGFTPQIPLDEGMTDLLSHFRNFGPFGKLQNFGE